MSKCVEILDAPRWPSDSQHERCLKPMTLSGLSTVCSAIIPSHEPLCVCVKPNEKRETPEGQSLFTGCLMPKTIQKPTVINHC